MQRLTRRRPNKIKSPERQQMWRELQTGRQRRWFQPRRCTVEPMQSLVKDIFEVERVWMRGNDNHRWACAALGVAVPVAPRLADQRSASTWRLKHLV